MEIINFDERRMVEGGTMRAWGELAYLKPLTEKQMEDYELRPAPGNPDRAARPSITAQLKEAARRAEPPKEPDKAKHNKSREDRYPGLTIDNIVLRGYQWYNILVGW